MLAQANAQRRARRDAEKQKRAQMVGALTATAAAVATAYFAPPLAPFAATAGYAVGTGLAGGEVPPETIPQGALQLMGGMQQYRQDQQQEAARQGLLEAIGPPSESGPMPMTPEPSESPFGFGQTETGAELEEQPVEQKPQGALVYSQRQNVMRAAIKANMLEPVVSALLRTDAASKQYQLLENGKQISIGSLEALTQEQARLELADKASDAPAPSRFIATIGTPSDKDLSAEAPKSKKYKKGSEEVTEQWNSATKKWESVATAPRVVGGAAQPPTTRNRDISGTQQVTEEYNPDTHTWKEISTTPRLAERETPSAVTLQNLYGQGYSSIKAPVGVNVEPAPVVLPGRFNTTEEAYKSGQSDAETTGA